MHITLVLNKNLYRQYNRYIKTDIPKSIRVRTLHSNSCIFLLSKNTIILNSPLTTIFYYYQKMFHQDRQNFVL